MTVLREDQLTDGLLADLRKAEVTLQASDPGEGLSWYPASASYHTVNGGIRVDVPVLHIAGKTLIGGKSASVPAAPLLPQCVIDALAMPRCYELVKFGRVDEAMEFRAKLIQDLTDFNRK